MPKSEESRFEPGDTVHVRNPIKGWVPGEPTHKEHLLLFDSLAAVCVEIGAQLACKLWLVGGPANDDSRAFGFAEVEQVIGRPAAQALWGHEYGEPVLQEAGTDPTS